jgi:hypothetical protein
MFNSLAKKIGKVPPKALVLSYKYSVIKEEENKELVTLENTSNKLKNYTKAICKSA